MLLCDTNIFIEIYRKNLSIRTELEKVGFDNVVVSDVTRAELFVGAKDKRELEAIRKYLNTLETLRIQSEISEMAVDFVDRYCLSHRLRLPDALIAATAVHYNIELFTLNIKDFIFLPVQLYHFNP